MPDPIDKILEENIRSLDDRPQAPKPTATPLPKQSQNLLPKLLGDEDPDKLSRDLFMRRLLSEDGLETFEGDFTSSDRSIWSKIGGDLASRGKSTGESLLAPIKEGYRLFRGTEDIFTGLGMIGGRMLKGVAGAPVGLGRMALGQDDPLGGTKRDFTQALEWTAAYRSALAEGFSLGGTKDFFAGNSQFLNEKLARAMESEPSAFWGEKFVASLVHPVNLVGWGTGSAVGRIGTRTLLGRTPFIGKIIEPYDLGYITFTNKTIDLALRPLGSLLRTTTSPALQAVSRAPQPVIVKTTVLKNGLLNYGRMFFGEAINSSQPAVTAQYIGKLLRRSKHAIEARGTPQDISIRGALDMLRPVTPDELFTRVGKVETGLLPTLLGDTKNLTPKQRSAWMKTLRNDHNFVWSMNSLLDDLSTNIDTSETTIGVFADRIARLVGNSWDTKQTSRLRAWANARLVERKSYIEKVKRLTPQQAHEDIANHAAELYGTRIRMGNERITYMQGLVGGIMDKIDPIYQTVWRKGIERYLARPSVEFILNFGLYPVGNALEESFLAVAGGTVPGMTDRVALNRMMAGLPLADPTLGTDVGMAIVERLMAGSQRLPSPRSVGKMRKIKAPVQFLKRGFIEISNGWSQAIRRNALGKFFLQELASDYPVLAGANPPLAQVLERVPAVPHQEQLFEKALAEVVKGGDSQLAALKREFTHKAISRGKMESIAAIGDNLDRSTKELFKQRIRSEKIPDPTELFEDMIKNERDAMLRHPEMLEEAFEGLIKELENFKVTNLEDFRLVDAALESWQKRLSESMHDIMTSSAEVATRVSQELRERGEGEVHEIWVENLNIIGRAIEFAENVARHTSEDVLRKLAKDAGVESGAALDWAIARTKEFDFWTQIWRKDLEIRTALVNRGARPWEIRGARAVHWNEVNSEWARLEGEKLFFKTKAMNPSAAIPFEMMPDVQRLAETEIWKTEWGKRMAQMEEMRQMMNKEMTNPLFTIAHEEEVAEWIRELAKHVGPNPAISKMRMEAGARANKRFKRAFVDFNHDDAIIYALRHIYPFALYETLIWAKMVRLGIQHPALMNIYGPEGAYWTETDTGYINMASMPTQVSPARLFGFNRIRRSFFTPSNIPLSNVGVAGKVEKFMKMGERGGFYPGWTFLLPFEAATGMQDVGKFMPSTMGSLFYGLVGTGLYAGMPGAQKIFEKMPDDFKDYYTNVMLFANGVDLQTATPEQRREAQKQVSQFLFAENFMSMFRLRPNRVTEVREMARVLVAAVGGITIEELRQIEESGRSIYEVVQLGPRQRELLSRSIGQYEDLFLLTLPLRAEDAKDAMIRDLEFWKLIEQARDTKSDTLNMANVGLEGGQMHPDFWKRIRKEAITRFQGVWENMEARTLDPKDRFFGVPLTLEQRERQREKLKQRTLSLSPVDEALYFMFNEVEIESFTHEATGQVDWNGYARAQDVVLNRYPPHIQSEVHSYLRSRKTSTEREFEQGHEEWGYFDTSRAIDWAEKHLGFSREQLERADKSLNDRKLQEYLEIRAGANVDLARLTTSGDPLLRILASATQQYRQSLKLTKEPKLDAWLRKFYPASAGGGLQVTHPVLQSLSETGT